MWHYVEESPAALRRAEETPHCTLVYDAKLKRMRYPLASS
jgi:hypothetical protein